MIAAICCPGPSLPITWRGDHDYDTVYVVNRAALTIPSFDWLCAGDEGFFAGLLAGANRPGLGVITMAKNLPAAAALYPGALGASWESIDQPYAAQHGRHLNWSVQVALCHASDSDHAVIEIYGADMDGGNDCTGYGGEDRTPERWRREREDLAFTISTLLATAGTTVRRITP